MKKIYLLVGWLLMLPLMQMAQRSITPRSLVTDNHNTTIFKDLVKPTDDNSYKERIEKVVKNSSILQLDKSILNTIVQDRPKQISIDVPVNDKIGTLTLLLVQVDPYDNDFQIKDDNGKSLNYLLDAVVHYRGIIQGQDKSIAAFSFTTSEIMGMISNANMGNIVVGKIDDKNNKDDLHVVYADIDMLVTPPMVGCGSDEDMTPPASADSLLPPMAETPTYASSKCVKNYLVVDRDIYDSKGATTISFITGIFNQVATLYANDSIQFVIQEILVHTTTDPYASYGSSSSTMLNQFRINLGTSYPGDIAHLMSYKASGGIAFVNTLCISAAAYRSAFSNLVSSYSVVPTYSWNVMVVSHEAGHTLGSHHTQKCVWNGTNTAIDGCVATEAGPDGTCALPPIPPEGGTIMSYCHVASVGINFSLGFGPQPGALIRQKVALASCLTTCAPSCNAPSDLAANSITPTSAVITFAGVSVEYGYLLQYKKSTDTAWTSINLTSNIYTLTSLTPSTVYQYKVAKVCDSTTTAFTSVQTFVTAILCTPPTSLTASSITTSSAVISFTGMASADNYVLQYKRTVDTTWNVVNLTSTSYTLTGLNSGTAYHYKISSLCDTVASTYTAVSSFSTLIFCDTTSSFNANSITATTATITLEAVTSAIGYALQYRKSGTTTWTTINFTGTSRNISGLTSNTVYNYRVATRCGTSLLSGYTNIKDFTTSSCPVVTAPSVSSITASTALISFTGTPGITTYVLQYKRSAVTTWTTVNVSGTSYTLTGLLPNTAYQYRVATKCGTASSTYTSINNFTTAVSCMTPTAPSASSVTTSSAVISFTGVSGASSYILQYKTAAATSWTTVSLTGTSFTLTGLTPSTVYQYKIATQCDTVTSTYSSESTFTTAILCNAPTAPSASSVTTSSALISFTGVSGASSYVLQYKTAAATSWTTVSLTGTSFTLSGLTPSTVYQYKIATQCDTVTSTYSSESTFTTAILCNAPTAPSASSVTTSSAVISFTGVSGASSYILQYKTAAATSWTTVSLTGTTYTISGLTGGTTYNYRIATQCGAETSSYTTASNFTTVTPCGTPTSLMATSVTSSSAVISFTGVSGATGYVLQYKSSSVATWTTLNITGTSYSLSGLIPSTTYQYRVATKCGTVTSSYTSTSLFTTPAACGTPTDPVISSITSNSAVLSFSGVPGATEYVIQYKRPADPTWTYVYITSTTYLLSGLLPSSTYYYILSSKCGTTWSASTGLYNFTTAAPCLSPINLAHTKLDDYSVSFTFDSVLGATSYIFQYKKSVGVDWEEMPVSENPFVLYGLDPSITYHGRIASICGSTTGIFSPVHIFSTNYCVPNRLESESEYISKLTIDTTYNLSGDNGGYANFSETINMSFQANDSILINLVPNSLYAMDSVNWYVYVDLNKDYDFNDAGELLYQNSSIGAIEEYMGIPAFPVSNTRLRVKMSRVADPDPCVDFSYGEVEDYGVSIVDSCTLVQLALQLDNHPSETSWLIKNYDGIVVAEGSGYEGAGVLINQNLCLPNGCYKFIITDSYGDGICCAYGTGSYNLTIPFSGLSFSGSSFGGYSSHVFCLPEGTAGLVMETMSLPVYEMTVSPNPLTGDIITLSLVSKAAGDAIISIKDLLGKTVLEQPYKVLDGNQLIKVNAPQLKTGVYSISIQGDLFHFQNKIMVRK